MAGPKTVCTQRGTSLAGPRFTGTDETFVTSHEAPFVYRFLEHVVECTHAKKDVPLSELMTVLRTLNVCR